MEKNKNYIQTTKRWLIELNDIKNDLNNNNITSIHKLFRDKKITSYWVYFLEKKNIVYKENKNWKWNEKIPISNSLINSFRLFVSESLQHGTLFKKNTNIKTENNNNLNQKEMQSPTPPPPVKKRGSYKKTTKPKVAIEKPKTQIVFSDPVKKVGLIRSFWRWLY